MIIDSACLNPSQMAEKLRKKKKINKMIAVGVPIDAVIHAMKREGLLRSPSRICAKDVTAYGVQESQIETLKRMLRAGVPPAAVKHRMFVMGIRKDIDNLVDFRFNLQSVLDSKAICA